MVWRTLHQYASVVHVEASYENTNDRFSTAARGDSALTSNTTMEGRRWLTPMISRDSMRMIVVDAEDKLISRSRLEVLRLTWECTSWLATLAYK